MLTAAFACIIYLVSFAGVPLVSGHVARGPREGKEEDMKAVDGEEGERSTHRARAVDA